MVDSQVSFLTLHIEYQTQLFARFVNSGGKHMNNSKALVAAGGERGGGIFGALVLTESCWLKK